MPEKMEVTAETVSIAAIQWLAALNSRLVEKEVLTIDEANEIAATAASMCLGAGSSEASALIKAMVPSSADIDAGAAAEARGVEIQRPAGND